MDAVVEMRGVTKSFGSVRAVEDVSFTVAAGELVAVLGPNGTGKTTTLEILEGFQRADRGAVRVLGADPWRAGPAWRERVGVVLQSCGFDPYLTVAEALRQRICWYPRPRPVEALLAATGLADLADRRIQLLSGGQQRRLDVALALVGDPELVFLDEPSTGLDASARRRMWDTIRALLADGRSILLTTHYLDEAAALADRIVVLAGGRIVAQGSPSSLVAAHGSEATIHFTLPASVDTGRLPIPAQARRGTATGTEVTIRANQLVRTLHTLTGWAATQDIELNDLTITRPSLEDAYLALTEQDTRCDSFA